MELKKIIRSALPPLLANLITYLRNRSNVVMLERAAMKGTSPPEVVDGYFTKNEAPEVGIMAEKIVAKIMKCGIVEPKFILDIGCGTGRYLKLMKARFAKAGLYGVDASESTIKNYTKKIDGINSAQWNMRSGVNPFKGVEFDFCLSISVLQYITVFQINYFFKIVHSLLKPTGTLFLQFPQSSSRYSFAGLFLNLNYTRYSPSYVLCIMRRNGFVIVDEGYVDSSTENTRRDFGYYVVANTARSG